MAALEIISCLGFGFNDLDLEVRSWLAHMCGPSSMFTINKMELLSDDQGTGVTVDFSHEEKGHGTARIYFSPKDEYSTVEPYIGSIWWG